MSGQDFLLDLIGLSCGVGSGAYLILVLHVVSATRGVCRRVLALLWPAHFVLLLWVVVVVVPGALGPSFGGYTARVCYLFLWVLPLVGSVFWYMRAHPNPLQIDWGRRDQHPEQSLVPALSPTELAAIRGETARSGRAVHYYLAAAGCGVGLILYLLLSRRAFLDYYLAALGCGVGLALYLLLFMRALRLATGTRRRVLRRLWLPSLMLYAPLLVAFRVAGRRLGLVGDYAAEICIPSLLGAAPVATVLWYTRRYPTPRSTELPKLDG